MKHFNLPSFFHLHLFRIFLLTLFFSLFLLILLSFTRADHREKYFASYESCAEDAPSRIVISPNDEPGEPLRITGTIFAGDGRTPLSGVMFSMYHTDARGYYSRNGENESKPRLTGCLRTDDRGRYEIKTIRPASYPHSRVQQHIHCQVSGRDFPKRVFEILFDDDPLLNKERREWAGRNGYIVIKLNKNSNGIYQGVVNMTAK